ncbi:selenoneine biosynthesis selenosugar synthase SenB [Massilia aerilata]|uniref:Selenoneine biosynthesis selenosugar synthase SenB n=1 Tax=Massilia aerilata TaxID=453817 RepID=A0ABW0RSX1_9BURK
MARPHILIVSPASARENNGNWQTASRWMRHLSAHAQVTVAQGWDASQPAPDLLVALHARRSAPALGAFAAAHPERPSLLVLTGTDLYRDIHADETARASLGQATALVLLQSQGLDELAPEERAKAHVIYQSAPLLRPARPRAGSCDIAMIGHLREEKDPLTFMRAAALVTRPEVRLLHVGGALDPALGAAARKTQEGAPRYRWLGALPHMPARRLLRRCRAMAICSRMEGGANVIIEAVMSGVPVLASSIGGNRGMLGEDYAGFFAPGDAAALARLIDRIAVDERFRNKLLRQCAARRRLFAPGRERAALLDLVDNLVLPHPAT